MEPRKGFFEALFDFSFSEFITARLIRLLYVLALIGLALVAVVSIFTGFVEGFGEGLLRLILSPIFFLLGAIVTRIYLELVIVIFRIAEHMARLVALTEARGGAPSPPEPPL